MNSPQQPKYQTTANLSKGYIALPRDFISWPCWSDGDLFRVYLYLVYRARWNPEPAKLEDCTIEAGEVVTTVRQIAEAISKPRKIACTSKIHAKLKALQRLGLIDAKSEQRFTHLIIKNYSQFRTESYEGRTETEQTQNKLRTETELNKEGIRKKKKDNTNTKWEVNPELPPPTLSPKSEPYLCADGEGYVWLTNTELDRLNAKLTEPCTTYLILSTADYAKRIKAKWWNEYSDHNLFLQNSVRRMRANGKVLFNHPTDGPGYYPVWEIEKLGGTHA